jgi:dTDP-6-deoxy-L-talose 4-dehydrogenase (NAD+)
MLSTGCRLVEGSLEIPPWSEIEAFAPEAALHLAWLVTPGLWADPAQNQKLAWESENLFHGLAKRGVRHLAGTGTALEYEATTKPMSEDATPLARTPCAYARAKLGVCAALRSTAEVQNARWSWFRIFNTFGPGEHPKRLVPWSMRKLAAGHPCETRTPYDIKDYTPVDNIASAMLWAFEKNESGILNVARGTGTSILELVRLIARIVGANESLITCPASAEAVTTSTSVADVTKLLATGWEPVMSLEDGLRQMWTTVQSSHS